MRFPDADENLRRARTMIESVRVAARGARVEIYHRASVRRRAGTAVQGEAPEILEGMEEGIAIRVRRGSSESVERVGFAAAAGAESVLAWTLDRALANARPTSGSRSLWASGVEAPLLDREGLRLPAVEELAAWLPGMGGCWVEAGVTVETLATDDGLLTSRARTRTWAMALLPSTPGGREQPRTGYGRTLAELDASGWRDAPLDAPPITPGAAPVLFVGEAARVVVLALTAALHGEGFRPGLPVGRGWSLRDYPADSFDDAGFPSESILLADGSATLGRIDGPGHLKRASYRDWPEAHPACLTIFGENAPFPSDATHIVDVRIHAPDPGFWIVEGDGYVVRGGSHQGWFRCAFARTSPTELVRRLVATAGPTRSHGTVVTPALVVEGLRLET